MIRALLFIFAVWLALGLLGAGMPVLSVPHVDFAINGDSFAHIGGWAGGRFFTVGIAVAAAVLALWVLFALVAGLLVFAVGLPILLLAIVLCAVLAPVMIPVVIVMAIIMGFFCMLGGLVA